MSTTTTSEFSRVQITNNLSVPVTISGTMSPDVITIESESPQLFDLNISSPPAVLTITIPVDGLPALEMLCMPNSSTRPAEGCPWTYSAEAFMQTYSYTVGDHIYTVTMNPDEGGGGIAMVGTVAMKNKPVQL